MSEIIIKEDNPSYDVLRELESVPRKVSHFITIDEEILENSELTSTEKILWGQIRSLGRRGNPCFASNEYLGQKMKSSAASIANMISSLVKQGLVHRVSYDGKVRKILALTPFERDCLVSNDRDKSVSERLFGLNQTVNRTSPICDLDSPPGLSPNRVNKGTIKIEEKEKIQKEKNERDASPRHGDTEVPVSELHGASAVDEELFPVEMTESESPRRATLNKPSNPSCQKPKSEKASKETSKSVGGLRLSVPNTQSTGQKEFLESWCKGYLSAKGRPYIIAYGKDNAAVKRLLSAGLTPDRLIELARVAWASSNAYIFGLASDISKFASNINTIADEADKNISPRNNGCEFKVY